MHRKGTWNPPLVEAIPSLLGPRSVSHTGWSEPCAGPLGHFSSYHFVALRYRGKKPAESPSALGIALRCPTTPSEGAKTVRKYSFHQPFASEGVHRAGANTSRRKNRRKSHPARQQSSLGVGFLRLSRNFIFSRMHDHRAAPSLPNPPNLTVSTRRGPYNL